MIVAVRLKVCKGQENAKELNLTIRDTEYGTPQTRPAHVEHRDFF